MDWLKERFKQAKANRHWIAMAFYACIFVAVVIVYSLVQDRLVQWANNNIDRNSEALMSWFWGFMASAWLAPVALGIVAVTWAFTFILLWYKLSPVQQVVRVLNEPPTQILQPPQEPQPKGRSEEDVAKLITKLDAFIREGHNDLRDLTIPHDVPDVQPSVSDWMEQIRQWAWESVPEYEDIINSEDGPLSADERMRNAGVDINLASLRIAIERQLNRLRRTKALLLIPDRATNQRQ